MKIAQKHSSIPTDEYLSKVEPVLLQSFPEREVAVNAFSVFIGKDIFTPIKTQPQGITNQIFHGI